jgi:hypothetical protein
MFGKIMSHRTILFEETWQRTDHLYFSICELLHSMYFFNTWIIDGRFCFLGLLILFTSVSSLLVKQWQNKKKMHFLSQTRKRMAKEKVFRFFLHGKQSRKKTHKLQWEEYARKISLFSLRATYKHEENQAYILLPTLNRKEKIRHN